MTDRIDGQLFIQLASMGGANLKANVKTVNELNVFPVPDGDTGTNMTMTLEQAAVAVQCEQNSVSAVSQALAHKMLYTARGNSGVILSQFFKGLASGLEGLETCGVQQFACALVRASESAYSAVSNPVEGTILTVAREIAEFAQIRSSSCASFEELLELILQKAHESLIKTPELLPVLKDAGVVDSGGAGLFYIFEGMQKYLLGRPIGSGSASVAVPANSPAGAFDENSELEYGYCTEFVLQLLKSKPMREQFDFEKAKAHLSRLGDSLDMFAEGTAVKIHIHTKTPANVIEYCQQFGEFATFKMENMTVQHTQTHIANNFAEEYVSNMPPHKKYAYVAVVLGDGMENLYVSAGVDQIVRGGQTMNPSAMDFVKVFDKINADHIIVLPNNSNVIMAAVQAAECYEKADVRVLRTTSMCQGYSALVLADPNAPDIETQLSIMEDSARQVVSAEVTQAIRDSEINGIKIQKGDYIAICDHEIVCSEKTPDKAAESLIDKVLAETDKDVVTVFYGKKASVNAYTKLSDYMLSNHRSVDFGVVYGGQETYEYIISLE
ncbi:MAG: DAK2 domain-containing protein [Clostridia bacterium]|nr:DAK2 domain-containing protein [Clostridia bacterium]